MITIATYTHSDEAFLARSRLEGSGIPVVVSNDLIASVLPLHSNAIGGIKLQVPEEEVERAREVLALPAITEEGVTHCPHCNSTRIDFRRLPFLMVLLMVVFGALFPAVSKSMRCLDCGRPFAPPPKNKEAQFPSSEETK